MCNVSELDLHLDSVVSELGELPWCLFTCKTLVVLKISGKFILNVPYHVCLPNVKTLSLQCIIYLGDATIQKLLSGCPVLEDLSFYIHEWERIWTLNVSVASLKRLSLSSNVELDEDVERVYRHKIVVDAPNLEFIDLADAWPNDILLKFLPKIVEAHIDMGHANDTIDVEKVDKLVLLFQSMVNVRRLFLGCLTFLILDEDIEFNLPRFCNLVFMELDYSNGPFQLMELLHSAPNLEALSFPKDMFRTGLNEIVQHMLQPILFIRVKIEGFNYERRGDIDLEFRMNDLERIPECLHHSLKLVEIKAFRGEEVELNIVWYLLENAMVLEKMTFFYRREIDIIKLQTDLTNHPRLSTNCQLHFKPDPRV